MTFAECMQLLGLHDAATVEQIKRAYRRLAQQMHPDKRRDDPQAQQEFIRISTAYRSLVNAARAVEKGKPVGVCYSCHEFDEMTIGTDGRPRCRRCIFQPAGGRLLPLPVYVVVKCVPTILLLGAGVYCLARALNNESRSWALAAFAAGLLGLISLAYTSLSIVHCIHPRERKMQQRQARNRK